MSDAPLLLTPGPLTTDPAVRAAMSKDWGSRDPAFIALTAELRALLAAADQSPHRPFASLVFSCTGRGKNLFGGPNHDAGAIAAQFGPIPSAGFFCNGEIGPVGPRNFIHGYTASIALLCDPD